MAMYRKKPVVIDACQMPSRDGDFTLAPEWLRDAMAAGVVWYDDKRHFAVHTLEGIMRGEVGAWIIRGIRGELYPCKSDIFAATYEPVHPVAGGLTG